MALGAQNNPPPPGTLVLFRRYSQNSIITATPTGTWRILRNLNSIGELGGISKKVGLILLKINKLLVNVSACLPSSGHKILMKCCGTFCLYIGCNVVLLLWTDFVGNFCDSLSTTAFKLQVVPRLLLIVSSLLLLFINSRIGQRNQPPTRQGTIYPTLSVTGI